MGGGRLRTWRFDYILPIKREEKSNIQGLYHLKFLISFSCTAYRARLCIPAGYILYITTT